MTQYFAMPSNYTIMAMVLLFELLQLSSAAPCKVCRDEVRDPSFQCWQCDTQLPSIASEQTICYNGTFPGEGVIKMACKTGKCVSYETDSTFTRTCLDFDMEKEGYCEGTKQDVQNTQCCYENLCNEPSTGSRHTIYMGIYFSSIVLLNVLYFHTVYL